MFGTDAIISKFVSWCESSNRLQAAVIFGSQVRAEKQSDIYSDIDMIMIVDDPEYFLNSNKWLNHIGNVHVSFTENAFAGGKGRRILFDNALDVDFIILPASVIDEPEKIDQIMLMFSRGYRVIVDKIGLEQILTRTPNYNISYTFPSEDEFLNIVNDFWFHSVWTAKKLLRGELWAAKSCLDYYMKQKLMSMIECHAHVINGIEYNTWHNGRFLDEWADDSILTRLPHAFARYDIKDVKNVLLLNMDLFRSIAIEIAQRLDYKYPNESDEYTTKWVKMSLDY